MSDASGIHLAAGDRVLLTRLDYLGDVIISLSLVDSLRRRWPGVEIDYLTRDGVAPLLDGDPRIARCFAMSRHAGTMETLRLVCALRSRRYRAVVDLYANPRSAALTRMTGAPVRIGGGRGARAHLFTHRVSNPVGGRSILASFHAHLVPLGVVDPPGKPVLHTDEETRRIARRSVDTLPASAQPRVGIHPGGKWTVKRWPAASFAELIRALCDDGVQPVVFTGPGEEAHTGEVRRRVGDAAAYVDVLPIGQFVAVLAEMDAVVACDGGIMHAAVAVGTPTVGIFGSAQPQLWFPYASFGPYRAAFIDVPCRPCHQHECPLGHVDCLNTLGMAQVRAAVHAVLRPGEGTSHG